MKSIRILLVTAVLLISGLAACMAQPDPAALEPAIAGPALLMFYTDN